MRPRFFFGSGPGNIMEAHRDWRAGVPHAGQMSVTFSSEFENFCTDHGAKAYIVSSNAHVGILDDGDFKLENRPKRAASGFRYHLEELRYGLSLALSARRFKATHAFLQSGSTHYFAMSLFRVFGIKVIPIMHNTLWPAGYPPTTLSARVIRFLDMCFFRWCASAVLAVSPECLRQVSGITGGKHCNLYPFTIQFDEAAFQPSEPPAHSLTFRLLFAGRFAANKGVYDLVEIMKLVEATIPGRVHLDVCGDGPDFHALKSIVEGSRIITLHGWTEPRKLRNIMKSSHASIVPTKSGFAEGMAMTAIEPILLGRPVITNTVVPALEVIREACIEARTDDIESYANCIVRLAKCPVEYRRLTDSCAALRKEFFDTSKSLRTTLNSAFSVMCRR